MGLLLLTMPFCVRAQFSYTSKNGAITITGYSGSGGTVNIPNSIAGQPVTTIGDSAFFSSSVITVTFPNSLNSIGNNAFYSCRSLINVTIPDAVTNVGSQCFWNCISLTNIAISANLTHIGDAAFAYGYNLKSITVDGANPAYASIGGILFDKNQSELIQSPGATATNYTVPMGVFSIGIQAFGDCNRLLGVYFQSNSPAVESTSFTGASRVTVYYLPNMTGWCNSFGGRPAVLWNPLAQSGDGKFGVQSNQFGFNITGTTNIPMVVVATTNLANAVWTPLQSCLVTNGSIYFSDPQYSNFPSRIYRIRSP